MFTLVLMPYLMPYLVTDIVTVSADVVPNKELERTGMSAPDLP